VRKLPVAFVPFLACLAADLHAATELGPGSPPSESYVVVWIVVGVFAFFALIVGFTWHILKAERKRMLEQKPPE
jgi:hypothetical protein